MATVRKPRKRKLPPVAPVVEVKLWPYVTVTYAGEADEHLDSVVVNIAWLLGLNAIGYGEDDKSRDILFEIDNPKQFHTKMSEGFAYWVKQYEKTYMRAVRVHFSE